MSPPRGAVTARLRELLADGQWHDLEAIMAEAGKVIPPGQAIRNQERMRRNSQRWNGREVRPRQVPIPHARQIESGRRAIIMERLRAKVFELDPPSQGGHGGSTRIAGRKVRWNP